MTVGYASLGRRYAKALSDLAFMAEKSAVVGESLQRFGHAWAQSDALRGAFFSPEFGQSQRKSLLRALGERLFLDSLVVNTLCLLSDRRRMGAVSAVIDAFFALVEAREGRVEAVVTTASPLSEAYFEELQKALQEVTHKRVTIRRKVDPSLLGGVVAQVEGKVFDGSLRTRLDEMEEALLQPPR